MFRRLICLAFLFFPLTATADTAVGTATDSEAMAVATTPVVHGGEWAEPWWIPRHEEKLATKDAMDTVDVVFIGDSITQGWEGAGKEVWAKTFEPMNSLNLGFSGDRTEHVLWRLDNGEIDGIDPKAVVIMIGTNNTGHRRDPPPVTAKGVELILDRVRNKLPGAKVLLLGIFPRGATADDPLRQINEAINEELSAMADANDAVTYKDIGDVFLADDGSLPEDIMPDRLHPNTKGYELWADAIAEDVRQLTLSPRG